MNNQIKELKAILKAISKLQNSWCYNLEDYNYRYSFSTKKDSVFIQKTSYRGIYYSYSPELITFENPKLIEFIEKYKYLIDK